MIQLHQTRVGIWGFGVVGKAALGFVRPIAQSVGVLDIRELTAAEHELLQANGATWYHMKGPEDVDAFFEAHDVVVPSAGIDLRPYARHLHKCINELDLFAAFFHKPIIAVTGSVGKTTTTVLLSQLLCQKYPLLWTGGNIGTSVFDLLVTQENYEAALIEVSSFQLEHCRSFAPDLALWTNFYPNHLDRHGSQQEYLRAKSNIFAHQHAGQHAIVPREIPHFVAAGGAFLHTHTMAAPVDQDELSSFFVRDGKICTRGMSGCVQPLVSLTDLPPVSFIQNWVLMCGTLHLLGVPLDSLKERVAAGTIPAHRLELCATYGGVDFYDDSKATTPAATQAALQKLQGRPIVLIVGGLSKGVHRQDFIKDLVGFVRVVYCFGQECEQLAAWCREYGLPCQQFNSLEGVIGHCVEHTRAGDIVLFSPAGSSFDQFANYHERGQMFKDLVARCCARRAEQPTH